MFLLVKGRLRISHWAHAPIIGLYSPFSICKETWLLVGFKNN